MERWNGAWNRWNGTRWNGTRETVPEDQWNGGTRWNGARGSLERWVEPVEP